MTLSRTNTLTELAATLWDVVILGAGPAGSTLALQLSRKGLRVLLVDQATFPRYKVCGGCLNGNALSALQYLGLGKLPNQLGGHHIQQLQLMSNDSSAHVAIENSISVSRSALDVALIQQGVDAGVTFCPGVRATLDELEEETRRVVLQDATERVIARSRIVILAHGLKAGTIAPHSRIGAGAVLNDTPQGYPLHTICMAVAEGGYVGGVHVEAGRYELAAAFDAGFVKAQGSLGQAAAAVLRRAGFPAIAGLDQALWKGTPLLTRRPNQCAGPHWFAVGDAAGYVEPFTGEGMAWAMNGAIALAPIVSAAVVHWNDDYCQLWNRTLACLVGRRQLVCRLLAKFLRSPCLTTTMIHSLAWWPALAGPVVRHLSRPTTFAHGGGL